MTFYTLRIIRWRLSCIVEQSGEWNFTIMGAGLSLIGAESLYANPLLLFATLILVPITAMVLYIVLKQYGSPLTKVPCYKAWPIVGDALHLKRDQTGEWGWWSAKLTRIFYSALLENSVQFFMFLFLVCITIITWPIIKGSSDHSITNCFIATMGMKKPATSSQG